MSIYITGNNLTIHDIHNVAYHNYKVELTEECKTKVLKCRQIVDNVTERGDIIYGLTTGFGSLAKCKINPKDASQLSRNIILSHAISVGESLPPEYVRAAILVRINALGKGFSGVQLESLEALVNLLNYNIIPIVPRLGSLACSGDLCLLSFVALAISSSLTENDTYDIDVMYENNKMKSQEAFNKAGLKKVILKSKEGLALTNGSTFTAGLAALCFYRAEKLYYNYMGSYAIMMEALRGVTNALESEIHEARNQIGQLETAKYIRNLLLGSEFVNTSGKIQDAYSLRNCPQILGTMYDTLKHCELIITRELNAATDNPLVFNEKVISGANFDGTPIGRVIDFLKIELCGQAKLSERRQFRILDSTLNNGLPDMLCEESVGLNSGYMITQYTSASLVQRCQILANPCTTLNIPTCGNTEDVNSNSWNAVLFCCDLLDCCEELISFEYLLAIRAISILKKTDKYKNLQLGLWTNIAYNILYKCLDNTTQDHILIQEQADIKKIICDNNFTNNIKVITC